MRKYTFGIDSVELVNQVTQSSYLRIQYSDVISFLMYVEKLQSHLLNC